MNSIQKLRIRFIEGQWFVEGAGPSQIPIDTALVDVVYLAPGYVEGYIVAIHGLPQEVAQDLTKFGLTVLGARGPSSQRAFIPRTRRGQLTADGRVEWAKR
jgi:hypothetical protein